MELRHLDTLLAIVEHGSFTAAADALHTVQSNVSEQVRQLETELGVELVVRNRRGALPTEFGEVVIGRARTIRQELEAMRSDLSMIAGLRTGRATLGVVGTISRWLVPAVVADLRERAPAVSFRVNEAASERLTAEIVEREIAQAVLTLPVSDSRLAVEPLLDEAMVGLVPVSFETATGTDEITLAELAEQPLILPPTGNPLRTEVDVAARVQGVSLSVLVEVEGVRLIADLVAAGMGVSIIPSTARPEAGSGVRMVRVMDMPPRRLALVSMRGVRLSLADQAVREAVLKFVGAARERGV